MKQWAESAGRTEAQKIWSNSSSRLVKYIPNFSDLKNLQHWLITREIKFLFGMNDWIYSDPEINCECENGFRTVEHWLFECHYTEHERDKLTKSLKISSLSNEFFINSKHKKVVIDYSKHCMEVSQHMGKEFEPNPKKI